MRQVYFDHQATTPVLPEVLAAMEPFFLRDFGSSSSLHRHGLAARDALKRSREKVAAFLNADSPDAIIFTSGGTEAANLAVKGAALAGRRTGNHIVVSSIEHPAVLESAALLEQEGFTVTRVPVNATGRINPVEIGAALTPGTVLVCVQHANHEIGTIQPVREIADLTVSRGIPLFVDASASAGWMPIDVQALGASLVSIAPHRFYGPKGVGVLYRHRRARLVSQIHGGNQEGGRRAGTENIPAIVGAGLAAEIAARELEGTRERLVKLQRELWEGLRAQVRYLRLNGPEPGPGRLVTNLNFCVEFAEGEGLALMCDMQGIALASGAACVTKAGKLSTVLAAIGVPPPLAQSNVLISLGRDNTSEDVGYFLETFPKAVERLRSMSPLWDEFQQGRVKPITEA